MMDSLRSVLIGLLLLCTCCSLQVQCMYGSFEAVVSVWSGCHRINESQGCYKTREAVCVRRADNHTAPWSYCQDRPATVDLCEEGSCVQNCAVGEWSAWSNCAGNCSATLYKTRSRTVFSPPRNGGAGCPPLLERMKCPCVSHLPFDSQPREHTWRTGRWGGCVPLNRTSQCGPGLRTRPVECVGRDGVTTVPQERCVIEDAFTYLQPPSPQKFCEVSCPCVLGEWSSFSPCTADCTTLPVQGKRSRTRQVIQPPTLNLSCTEPLEEIQQCSLSTPHSCPTYEWEASGWSPCQFTNEATCGSGHMTRYIYCMAVGRDGNLSHVEDSFCQSVRPPSIQSCRVQCPQACQVGEWSDWSNCSQWSDLSDWPGCPSAYGQQTYTNRTRAILVPPQGGEVCPPTLELRPCPSLPCFRWYTGEYSVCIRVQTGCGSGSRTRNVHCEDLEGNAVADPTLCPTPRPTQTSPCQIPCPDDCVLSDWSEWSPCSETCGRHVGNRTRQRHMLAYGTSCPYSSDDLSETELCSDPRPCEVESYHIQQVPSLVCVPTDDPPNIDLEGSGGSQQLFSGGCVGVRNITNICMQGENVVTSASECPISFLPFHLELCQLPCTSECSLSEWSAYSPCSTSCGYGMRSRSRRLLQFPTTPTSDCPNVDHNGVEMEFERCFSRNCNVSWREGEWSTCQLYSRIRSEECGLGYQNRTVACVDTETGNVVCDSDCRSAGLDRPQAVRSCHQQCEFKCLVTEWSEFGRCSFGGNVTSQREIIPRIGCTDLVQCCPGLETIQLTKTASCPTFNPSSVIAVASRDWGECILDSPVDTCGNGLEYQRGVFCADSMLYTPVDASFCALANQVLSELNRSCSIRCQRNCEQSDWTPWSSCSATCGSGLRTRTRVTEDQPRPGGRPCGPEMETDVCFNAPCPLVEVVPSPYGACVPENATSMCGAGMRVREPLCFVNKVHQELSVCTNLGVVQEFEVVESCSLDCPGECVVGEWGEWSECPTGCPPGSCMQQRQRSVLRQDSNGGCSKTVWEQRVCIPVPETYEYRTGPWWNCTLTSPTIQEVDSLTLNHYCGVGVHSRNITCFNTTGSTDELVADIFCEEAGVARPAATERCELPCPVDCQVSAFSDWSECAMCQPNAMQRRSRSVLIPPLFDGEACPALEETRPCVPSGCVVSDSTIIGSFVSVDFTEESQCGSVLQLQPLSCRRNTEFLLPSECPQGESYSSLVCPRDPNCTYGEWSDWSNCMSLCHTPGVEFSFRTRPLLSSLSMLSEACAGGQLQQRECSNSVSGATPSQNETETAATPTPCGLDFMWETGEWNQNEREVYCLSNSGVRVENQACPSAIRPQSQNETCSSCPERGVCQNVDGACVLTCQLSTEVVQGACLPTVQGRCFNDGHCLYPNHVCDEEREVCECDQGFISTDNGCFPPTMSTTRPTIAMETTSSRAGPPTNGSTSGGTEVGGTSPTPTTGMTTLEPVDPGGLGVIHFVLISLLPLLIIIIIIIVVIGITYRCRKSLEVPDHEDEIKRRRMKATISAPSPLPQTAEEMSYRLTGGSGSSVRGDHFGADLHNGGVHRYGMAATTFLGDEEVDEPFSSDQYSPQHRPGEMVHPVPVAAPLVPVGGIPPLPPGRTFSLSREDEERGSPPRLDHIPHRYQPPYLADFPDGGMTTDMTYTTDEDTMATTSVPPSSAGASPNASRRPLPPHHVYHHDHGYHHNHVHHDHTHSGSHVTSSENPYVTMQRMTPVYAEVSKNRHGGRSQSPPPQGYHSDHASPRHLMHPGERDGRIAVGLDNSMLRAVTQLEEHPPNSTCHTPTSVRSQPHPHRGGGGGHQRRRHGRRRRHHHARSPRHHDHGDAHYRYDNGHHGNGGGYYNRSDGQLSSDHDHYSTSDEYPALSEPRSPAHHHHEDYPMDYSSMSLPRSHRSPPGGHAYPPRSHDYIPDHRSYEWQEREYYPGDGGYRSPTHYQPHPHYDEHRWYEHEPRPRILSDHYIRESYRHRNDHYSPSRSRSMQQTRSRDRYPHSRDNTPPPHSPPPAPRDPPNFIPPVPPHSHRSQISTDLTDDDYDYPCQSEPSEPNLQPHQLKKLKDEAHRDLTSPYARPRPLNSGSSSKEQVSSRVTSPYDYPRIRGAGSGVSQPSTPNLNSGPSGLFSTAGGQSSSVSTPQMSRSNPVDLDSTPQMPRHFNQQRTTVLNHQHQPAHVTTTAPTPLATGGVVSAPPQPSLSAPNPQTAPSSMAVSTPVSSTPQSGSLSSTPKLPGSNRPNLTIQISPVLNDHSPDPGSPLSRRRHPPMSPLVLHSNTISDGSSRQSSEVTAAAGEEEVMDHLEPRQTVQHQIAVHQ